MGNKKIRPYLMWKFDEKKNKDLSHMSKIVTYV